MTTVEITADRWVRWDDLSNHANEKACKPWAQRLTDTHDKYGVTGDWLDDQRIDGHPHFDVSGLVPGDLLKVSGASHDNKKHQHYRVVDLSNGSLEVERISETEAIEDLEADDGTLELRQAVVSRLDDLDRDELRMVIAVIDDRL